MTMDRLGITLYFSQIDLQITQVSYKDPFKLKTYSLKINLKIMEGFFGDLAADLSHGECGV